MSARRPRARTPLVAAAVVLAATLGPGCEPGAPIPEVDLLVRVATDAAEVEVGRPFTLTVVRVWTKDLVPTAFDERALAPLAVARADVSTRDDDRRVEETRRYRARAFTLDDVTLAGVAFAAVPAKGGVARTTKAAPLRLHVKPSLDPRAPGAPEGPGPLPARPFSWVLLGLLGLLAFLVGSVGTTLALRHRRRRAALPAPAAPTTPAGPAPDAVAAAALAALRAREATTPDARCAQVVEAAETVRAYVTARFGVRAQERTSRELVAALVATGRMDEGARIALAHVVGPADFVKFADRAPSPEERTRVLDAADEFVRRTAAPVRTAGGDGGAPRDGEGPP